MTSHLKDRLAGYKLPWLTLPLLKFLENIAHLSFCFITDSPSLVSSLPFYALIPPLYFILYHQADRRYHVLSNHPQKQYFPKPTLLIFVYILFKHFLLILQCSGLICSQYFLTQSWTVFPEVIHLYFRTTCQPHALSPPSSPLFPIVIA